MSEKAVTLDVREDIRRGGDPFSKIMQTVAGLKDTEDLLLLAPFEPVPLFGVLRMRGFTHEAKALPNGDWEVRFSRASQPSFPTAKSDTSAPQAPKRGSVAGEIIDVDARGLEPPQPLVKIIEALATLPPGAKLRAQTDRRPVHLYAQIEDRGFAWETEEQSDGSFVTYVRRR